MREKDRRRSKGNKGTRRGITQMEEEIIGEVEKIMDGKKGEGRETDSVTQVEEEIMGEVEKVLKEVKGQENGAEEKMKTKKKKGGRGRKRQEVQKIEETEEEQPIRTPIELMTRLTKKDPGLKYKEEQSGKEVSYLDLQLKIKEDKLLVNVFRKPTHVWYLPTWKSRAPIQHKKAAVLPLLIRAHRILKDATIKGKEVQNIFGKALNKGYPIRVIRRWNKKAEEVAKRPRDDKEESKTYRNISTTNMDKEIRKILRPKGVEMVSRRRGTLFDNIRSDKNSRKKLDIPGIYKVSLTRGKKVNCNSTVLRSANVRR